MPRTEETLEAIRKQMRAPAWQAKTDDTAALETLMAQPLERLTPGPQSKTGEPRLSDLALAEQWPVTDDLLAMASRRRIPARKPVRGGTDG